MSGGTYILLFGWMPNPDGPIRPLVARSREMLDGIPTVLRPAPEFESVQHVLGREFERFEARMAVVQAQFFPQTATEMGLPIWESLLRITPADSSTQAQRRENVIARLRQTSAGGAEWEAGLTALIGPSWTYLEHDPGDDETPDPYTVRVVVPFAPGSDTFVSIERRLREITPANTDLVILSVEGFLLDLSELDQEAFGS